MLPCLYEIGPTWSSNKNTDVELNVLIGNKHVQVELKAEKFESSPKLHNEYLLHVQRSDPDYFPEAGDDDELDTDPIKDFYSWAMEPFSTMFHEMDPLDQDRQYTLQDCLYPEKVLYTLQADGDILSPVQLPSTSSFRNVGVRLPEAQSNLNSLFPVFSPKEIHVPLAPGTNTLPTQLNKVYVGGERPFYHFKRLLSGDVSMTVTEISTYAKILAAALGEEVRISRLFGLVKDEQTSRIVGLLLSYIECGPHGPLSCERRTLTDISLCKKWLDQISNSLHALHANNIAWGDAKPANVVIDEHDDAYLIDFGGGYTAGWVDKELQNTIEGDLQSLSRIAKFLTPEVKHAT
ncbi:hypothetical protein BT63DRAFT_263871 [Microthyrium microscopicum]|uniref:Protein kinase domain-containing protein n=1 Tax=Microthyrium microscopicum TaxID=703497 RepID=A0A6A6UCC8_9PEZI|nr:hypothetical protein BT63DRAFT_263871 [Microthyrium microscopicum]